METLYSPELITALKNKWLLLDTNIIKDASVKPTLFNEFFNALKEENVTLSTIDFVNYELLKGSADTVKYQAKEQLIGDITDVKIPIVPKTLELAYELIKKYKIDGTALSMTDLLLGALLMQYGKSIYLITRDTTDFMQNIFDLSFVLNVPHAKGIFTYGVYQYTK